MCATLRLMVVAKKVAAQSARASWLGTCLTYVASFTRFN